MNHRLVALSLSVLITGLQAGCAVPSSDAAGRPMIAPESPEASFLRRAAASSEAQTQWARIALERADHLAVRRLAERIVSDHRVAHTSATAVARQTGVETPSRLTWEDQMTADRLRLLHPDDFDRAYLELVANDHEGYVAALEAQATARDQRVRAIARDALPEIGEHLVHSRAMAERLAEATN